MVSIARRDCLMVLVLVKYAIGSGRQISRIINGQWSSITCSYSAASSTNDETKFVNRSSSSPVFIDVYYIISHFTGMYIV